jgi:putative copper export protein/mono/diheme cytochrome c family protein
MALLRGLHLAATLSLLGTAGFLAWMLPAVASRSQALRRRLTRVWWVSGVVALLAGVAWFTLQAGAIAGAGSTAELWAAVPVVAGHTRFGVNLAVRLALLLGATVLGIAGRGVYVAIGLALAALGLQGVIGHAGATAGTIGSSLVVSEALHLAAAGIWLGALLPLWISLRALPAQAGAAICQRFSPIGLACVLVLAGTGFAQALALVGSMPALLGTAYGHIALLKIALFLLALVLAAVNRLWLTDRLAAGIGERHLLICIGVETIVGLAIVVVAAFLASTVPGVHEAPVWPFSWQFSLVTVREAPEFRQEVFVSLLIIGVALLLTVAALLWGRLFLPALVLLLTTVVWRGPSFSVLLIEAYPTSFQTAPAGFSAASIARGQTLFLQNCVACHGPEGAGDGPAAARMRIRPADLTQPHILEHTDGELFWYLTHGIDDPEGGLAMPGFADALSADDRWAVVNYVRAHNAGVAMQQQAAFDLPVQAPSMPIVCNGLNASSMHDLLGHAVLIVLGAPAISVPLQDAVTLSVTEDTSQPQPGRCAAAEAAAFNVYAVLADLPVDKAAGSAFLVDPEGWIRAVQRPNATGGWHSPDDLLAAIRGICAHAIEQTSGVPHEHHH